MNRTWPQDAPDPHQFHYLTFTPDMDEDEAAARFRAKHERWPEWVYEYLGYLRVGPIEEGGHE